MVSYDPEQGESYYNESNKTFGGFSLSLEDWHDVDPNEELLDKSIEDIYHSEKPTFYTLRSKSSDDLHTNIVLVENNHGSGHKIIPFYVEPRPSSLVYRGREMFETIKRKSSENRCYDESTVDLDGGKEIVSEERKDYPDYYLYTWDNADPIAYIPSTYGDPTNVVGLEDETVWWSAKDVYFAPDSYLCELCGWTDLYLQKTV